MDIERSVDVAAPPDRVWAIISDVERWPEWTTSVTSVERLDADRLDVGSRMRFRQPRLPVAVWTVTVVEPNQYIEWRNTTPGVKSVAGHRIESKSDALTRVTLSIDWNGPLAPLIRLLYGKISRRYVETEAAGLKRRCEAAD